MPRLGGARQRVGNHLPLAMPPWAETRALCLVVPIPALPVNIVVTPAAVFAASATSVRRLLARLAVQAVPVEQPPRAVRPQREGVVASPLATATALLLALLVATMRAAAPATIPTIVGNAGTYVRAPRPCVKTGNAPLSLARRS